MATLKSALDENNGVGPGFHFLRHALSILIVLHHCRAALWWTASATTKASVHLQGGEPIPQGFTLQAAIRPVLFTLVGMFFALSGFLVTGSALRNRNIKTFFANRALRILPALSVEVTLSALILGPLVTSLALSQYFTDPQFFRYFGNIVGHITFFLPGVFEQLPWPRVVNGNLWTLPPEFWCYACMMAAMLLGLLWRPRFLATAAAVVIAVILALEIYDPSRFGVANIGNQFPGWYIIFLFWVGAIFYVFADKIPLSMPLFLVCAIAFWLMIETRTVTTLSGVLLSYCMVYIGMMPFTRWNRWFKSDYSYGIYLYGFPIMQTLLYFLLPFIGKEGRPTQLVILFPLTIFATLLFAMFSWRFIEKPALGLRKYFVPARAK